jgi:hypothetical protein
MGRTCSVCAHPDAFFINEELVLHKQSNRAITRQFGLSKDAVARHREHIPRLLVQALEAEEASQADDLLGQVRDLQRRTLAILDGAENDGADERRTALAAIREARSNLELLGRLAGELQEGTQINLSLNPEFVEFKTLVLLSLEDYPEAREALARAIKDARMARGGLRGVS